MSPEELWKSLEPQGKAIEQELMNREVIANAMLDGMLTGMGIYSVAYNHDLGMMELRTIGSRPDIMIIDECKPLMSEDTAAVIDCIREDPLAGQQVIIVDSLGCMDLRIAQNEASSRRRAGSLALAALAMEAIAAPGDPWHIKKMSKKNYAAPRQSFRARMRSVNRNR